MKTAENGKIGLVLEGGGMRGLYTAGVLDVFMEHSLRADTICGTSAGAIFGMNLPSGQKGRVLRYNLKLAGDPRYISLQSLLSTGNICNVEFCYHTLPDEFDPYDYDAFTRSGVDFFACATNLLSGEPAYLKITDAHKQMEALRASASLPFLSKEVYIDGIPYLDGGISDNIPMDKCIWEGCEKIIVVLTHPRDYVKNERLYLASRLFFPRNKTLQEVFKHRNEKYNERLAQINQMEAEGKIFVLRPSRHIKVGRLEKNPARLQAIYDMGVQDTNTQWDKLRTYLSRHYVP